MGRDVIVACDFASAEATFAFLDKFAGCSRKPFVKIGMELYYAEGPAIVKERKDAVSSVKFLSVVVRSAVSMVWKSQGNAI